MHLAFIIFMVITIVLLFTTMILTAMAADKAQKDDGKKECRKWSIWAAVTTGLSVLGVFIILGLFIYFTRHETKQSIVEGYGRLGQGISGLSRGMSSGPGPQQAKI